MKKVLSLVLAVVMMMSLMAISAAAEADSHLVAVLPAVIVVVVSAVVHGGGVPLVGHELARHLHPDVDARRRRVPLKCLAVDTARDEVVLEDEIIGPLRHVACHHLGVAL